MTMPSEEGRPAGWPKGELYEGLCLLGIAECLWLIGHQLGLFSRLQAFSLESGLSDFIFLGFLMSFALAAASALKSFRLRREIAGRREAESTAQSIARSDALTGLPNRRMLAETVDATHQQGSGGALLVIDLDRFKPVNDGYGHAAGDAVLCGLADRLRAALPRGAVAARLGGDEFAAFLPGWDRGDDLMRLCQQIVHRLAEPFPWQSTQVDVGATIGIALMPQDACEAEALMRAADIAMYRGKREGRGTFRFFEQAMDEELKAHVELETALRAAIKSGEVQPYYQPLVDLQSGRLLGFEILARWHHPVRGSIPPSVFIPIAEDTGLVADLCYAVLRQACRDAADWPAHIRLAVNISPVQFSDKLLAPRILSIIRESGFHPGRLEVEITESALMGDLDVARTTLGLLQAAGVSIALDDFGTGYSSLYHLREMRFDKIKIDRSFVQSLGDSDESAKIIGAILSLGRSLGIRTTAEGIETEDNSALLSAMGCATGQGYLFGRAAPAAEVSAQFEAERGLSDGQRAA